MGLPQIITTLAGAFIFPFVIRLVWGRYVAETGIVGGILAGGFIVGTTWMLNHGVGLIFQSGTAWVDMAFAAGPGLFVASALAGDDVGKGAVDFLFAIIGGILAGVIITMM